MGEVWRAHDTKLERDVAIKTLPATFAAVTERPQINVVLNWVSELERLVPVD